MAANLFGRLLYLTMPMPLWKQYILIFVFIAAIFILGYWACKFADWCTAKKDAPKSQEAEGEI